MKNIDRWAIVAKLVNDMRENQGWAGETHIQKTLFFLQELLQVPSGYKFVLYRHGPYSFDLHDDLGKMLTNSIVGLEPRPPYGPSFGIEDVGNRLLQQRSPTIDLYSKQFKFIVDTLGRKDVRDLERLGTALLMRTKFPKADQTTLAMRIIESKPHVPENLALDAVKEANRIERDAEDMGLLTRFC